MAIRRTDTEKWKKHFIRSLKSPYKLFWLYLMDDCDHAGIWHVDMEIASIRTGENLVLEEALKFLAGKIFSFDRDEKWFIPDFIIFQYGELNEKNRVHESVIKILKKYDLYEKFINNDFENEIKNKPLISPLQGANNYKPITINHKPITKKEKPLKIKYRENIFLTEEENDRLILKLGNETTELCYDYLAGYKIEKKYKTESDYLTILRWVIDAVEKKNKEKNLTNGKLNRTDQINQHYADAQRKTIQILDKLRGTDSFGETGI